MGSWAKCDFKQFERLQKKMQKLQQKDMNAFCEAAAKELAARLLAKVIKRTPVGNYNDGRVGGTLRRGWTADSEKAAMYGALFNGNSAARSYAQNLPITRVGNDYVIDIINPVSYASYVEYGHRTRGHKGWVKGQFMLTKSEIELSAQAPQVLEKKLVKYLGEIFND